MAGTEVPRYAAALDFANLWREFPPAPDYITGAYLNSRDHIAAAQEHCFLRQMTRAWQVPFYQRHWGAHGMEPGDIRSIADLRRIPPFTVDDLRASIERAPPWGDLVDLDGLRANPLPLVLQTSGGTTGLPRAMLYAPQDREVMNIITGRRLFMQGVRPFDVVQVTLALGLANGGLLAREGIWKYSGAIPVMTGTGAQTPSRRQIELMKAWGTVHLVGFPAYLRHLASVASEEMRIEPQSFGIRSLITHMGTDSRATLEDLWGAKAYDTYGTNECGSLAADCEHRQGMHVFEDAFHLEIVDTDTLQPVPDGAKGVVLQTTLFKHIAPLIRFNSADISSFASGACPCGSHLRRLTAIYGRADNMVKLRGTNVFPEAIGAVIADFKALNGEYVCVVETVGHSDEMTVYAEQVGPGAPSQDLSAMLAGRLKEVLGVKLTAVVSGPGTLQALTKSQSETKPKRLLDKRRLV